MFQKILSKLEMYFTFVVGIGGLAVVLIFMLSGSPQASSTAPSEQLGSSKIYLPIVYSPPPQPIVHYFDKFDGKKRWPRETDLINAKCLSDYREKRYVTGAKPGKNCFYEAPRAAERRLGIFEVKAWQIDNPYPFSVFSLSSSSEVKGNEVEIQRSKEFRYGIYINADDDRDNYYLFQVEYDSNKCKWKLTRREDSDSDTVTDGDCRSASKGYKGHNIIKIDHTSTGRIKVYMNDNLLGSYVDDDPLTDDELGLYIKNESDNRAAVVIFDNFQVYHWP